MESPKINELLEKYWNGDTSLEEEEALRKYFSENELPVGQKGAAALFRHYEADRRFKTLAPDFDEEIMRKISRQKASFDWRPMLRIAAVLTIFLVMALLLKQYLLPSPVTHRTATENTTDTYEDPQLAYEQTKQALLLVSSLMNEGTRYMEELENFSEAQETIKTEKR